MDAMKRSPRPGESPQTGENAFSDARPLSPGVRTGLMLVVIAPMAVCYPAIKTGLAFAPPLQFAGVRTLLGGLVLLIVLVLRQQPLWPQARLARWILPLGVMATTFTVGAMFASPAYTGAGIASVLGNTQPLIISVLAALVLGEQIRLARQNTMTTASTKGSNVELVKGAAAYVFPSAAYIAVAEKPRVCGDQKP